MKTTHKSETPITASIKLSNFMNSDNPIEYEIGRVLEEITEIRKTFSSGKYTRNIITEILTPTYFNHLMNNYRFKKMDDVIQKIKNTIGEIDSFTKKEINRIDSSLMNKVFSLKEQLLALGEKLEKTIEL